MLAASSQNVIVRIDKAAQKAKREKSGSILIPVAFQFMRYNLQYGIIEKIGRVAHEQFPEMEIGDTLLFHHTIEDGEDHLLDVLPNQDELRFVNGRNSVDTRNFQIFAVVKPDDTLIPSPMFLFLDKMIRPGLKNLRKKSTIITTDEEMWKEPERIRLVIKDLEQQESWLAESWAHLQDRQFVSDEELRGFEDAERAIISMRNERGRLTRELGNRCIYSSGLLHIHERTSAMLGLKPGDRIMTDNRVMYPLDFQGMQFLLIAFDQVWAVEP